MVQDGDHSSGTGVATGLKRPTRSACPSGPKGGPPLKRNLFGLAPGGGCRAMPVARHAGGLLPHRFTLTRHRCGRRAVCSLWPFPWGRPRSPLATSLPCGVRTFLHRPTAGTCGNLLGKPLIQRKAPGDDLGTSQKTAAATLHPPFRYPALFLSALSTLDQTTW